MAPPPRSATLAAKHYVLFDLPADKGLELKTNQPSLGSWVPDIDGHPALPFSSASYTTKPRPVYRTRSLSL